MPRKEFVERQWQLSPNADWVLTGKVNWTRPPEKNILRISVAWHSPIGAGG